MWIDSGALNSRMHWQKQEQKESGWTEKNGIWEQDYVIGVKRPVHTYSNDLLSITISDIKEQCNFEFIFDVGQKECYMLELITWIGCSCKRKEFPKYNAVWPHIWLSWEYAISDGFHCHPFYWKWTLQARLMDYRIHKLTLHFLCFNAKKIVSLNEIVTKQCIAPPPTN
jgi:hypothetical protein